MVRFDVDEQGNPAGRYIDMPRGIHMLDEHSVEFNLYAPGADKVEVDVFDCGKLELRRSVQHEGYWTGILGNLEKGFHYVTFDVNGIRVVNPDAPVGYGCFQTINYIEVPEKDFKYPCSEIFHMDMSEWITIPLHRLADRNYVMCIRRPDMRQGISHIPYCIYSMEAVRMRSAGLDRVR